MSKRHIWLPILLSIVAVGCVITRTGLTSGGPPPPDAPPQKADLASSEAVLHYLEHMAYYPGYIQAAHKTKSPEADAMMNALRVISRVDPRILEGVYLAESRYSPMPDRYEKVPGWNDTVIDQLRILTKLTFQVEDLKGPKLFRSMSDDETHPNDWLWPVVRVRGSLELAVSEPNDSSGPPTLSTYAEYLYVKKHARRRGETQSPPNSDLAPGSAAPPIGSFSNAFGKMQPGEELSLPLKERPRTLYERLGRSLRNRDDWSSTPLETDLSVLDLVYESKRWKVAVWSGFWGNKEKVAYLDVLRKQ